MAQYVAFVAFAALLAIAPGPDTFLTLRATVVGGRRRGLDTIAGISAANIVQGLFAASGLGAILMHAEVLFRVIRWAGVAYLAYLGISAIVAARRAGDEGRDSGSVRPTRGHAASARQGFLCNITNPKVLAFNLAVLPQFVGRGAGVAVLVAYAMTLAVVGLVVLLTVVWVAGAAGRALRRQRIRRGIEAGTGLAMLGFAGALASDA